VRSATATPRGGRDLLGQPREAFVQRDDLIRGRANGYVLILQVHPLAVVAVFDAFLAPGALDQDAAHGLGRRGEEMTPAIPVRLLTAAEQAQVGLLDQGRGLERLPGPLVGQSLCCQQSQLVINQRHELAGGVWVALFDGRQDLSDLRHGHL
jgi:hypothetical protein